MTVPLRFANVLAFVVIDVPNAVALLLVATSALLETCLTEILAPQQLALVNFCYR
jgi:hypothetical protein